MNNKRKIIVFIIIALISIGGLVFKGYFADEIYVLNEKDNASSNEASISQHNLENNDSNTKTIQLKDKKSKDKNVRVRDITIYVSGEVVNPGVVTINSDQRLADAVEKLGGLTQNADMNNINLAIKLEDEMHYIIPKKGEKIETNTMTNQDLSSNGIIDESNTNSNNNEGNKININTATIDELDKIPGVGEATANKILSYREENGSFKSIEEIKNVNGIGEKKFENMRDLICVK